MAEIVEDIAPRTITIPTADLISGADYHANAISGQLIMSGAKLWVRGSTKWELVSST